MSKPSQEVSHIIEGGPVPAPSPVAPTPAGRGIALLIGALVLFTLMDVAAKRLGQSYHPAQVIWARFAVNLALVSLVFRGSFLRHARSRQPRLQLAVAPRVKLGHPGFGQRLAARARFPCGAVKPFGMIAGLAASGKKVGNRINN